MKTIEIQDSFLAQARRTKCGVTLFLMNGFQMRGVISAFDPFVVVLVSDGRQQMIYKHAISTVVPERPFTLEPRAMPSVTEAGPEHAVL